MLSADRVAGVVVESLSRADCGSAGGTAFGTAVGGGAKVVPAPAADAFERRRAKASA